MSKIVFIIGMRRSGTSLLRKIIKTHNRVEDIEFEPNELLEICERVGIPRYKKEPFFINTIQRFKQIRDKWYGAKLAVNPGIEAMRWQRLEEVFDKPHYVFIRRRPHDTYDSWIKNETSTRGICDINLYMGWWLHINASFTHFVKRNIGRSIIIDYEDLCEKPNETMKKVWSLLGIQTPPNDISAFIKSKK